MTSSLTALVADLGGTNTRVALTDGAKVRTETIKRFRNSEHPDLPSVLSAYMTDQSVTPDAACVAMAGPVRDGVGELTNLSWTVERNAVAKATGAATVAVLTGPAPRAVLSPRAYVVLDSIADLPRWLATQT